MSVFTVTVAPAAWAAKGESIRKAVSATTEMVGRTFNELTGLDVD